MRYMVFFLALLLSAAALGNNCHHRTARVGGKLIVVGDAARKAHELGPNRQARLENRYGGSAGYRLDFYERNKTVEVHIRGGTAQMICQRNG